MGQRACTCESRPFPATPAVNLYLTDEFWRQSLSDLCATCAQDVCKMCTYVMFDIHEPNAFRKCSTWWVLEKSEEPCRFLNKFVHACARCQCNSCKSVAWFCSLFWTLNESELWMYIGRIAPNLKNLKKLLALLLPDLYEPMMNTRAPDGANNKDKREWVKIEKGKS